MVRAALYSIFFIGFNIFKFTNYLSRYYQLRQHYIFCCGALFYIFSFDIISFVH